MRNLRHSNPFGFGLSYTTFDYANIKLSREKAALGSTVMASVEVTNTGDRLGEEVVPTLYSG